MWYNRSIKRQGVKRMLRESKELQNSFHSVLYEKIPESHILKQIDKAIDFSFINDLLEAATVKISADRQKSRK